MSRLAGDESRPALPALRAAEVAADRVAAVPAGLVVVGVFYLMATTVLGGLWSAAASAAGGEVAGYTAVALIWYVATTEATTISLPQRLIEELGDDIGSERIVGEMLRPSRVVTIRLASHLGAALPRLAVCVTLGVVFATIVGGVPPSGGALVLAAPSLLLAISVNLAGQHLFGAIAFWVFDAKGAWFLYQKLVFVLGGMLIPLEVMPGWLELTARLLPFSAMSYAPARLASGSFEPELLLVQLGWLVVLVAAVVWAFAAGERRLAAADR